MTAVAVAVFMELDGIFKLEGEQKSSAEGFSKLTTFLFVLRLWKESYIRCGAITAAHQKRNLKRFRRKSETELS